MNFKPDIAGEFLESLFCHSQSIDTSIKGLVLAIKLVNVIIRNNLNCTNQMYNYSM